MSLDLGSLDTVDPVTRSALYRMQRYINQLESQIVEMTASGKGNSKLTPIQLAQIQKALSSSGSNPLNITGLAGVPKTTP